jgi:SAM-dependent methyltransferase
MPPEYFQLAVSSLVGDETLKQASSVYKLFRTVIEKHCGSVADRNAVLDFGCGWGRVMRFFMKDIEPARLYGIEEWKEQVEHAKATNRWCNFLHVNKEPPTQLPDGKFDVIFSFSVFSHLSEDSHKRWLAEFKRILVPGGLILATTWGREHSDHLERVRRGAHQTWDKHYNNMIQARFSGKEKWLSEYDNGHFCHVDLGYAGNEHYGETCIPEEYVRAEWGKSFAILDYINDRSVCMQNLIVARG